MGDERERERERDTVCLYKKDTFTLLVLNPIVLTLAAEFQDSCCADSENALCESVMFGCTVLLVGEEGYCLSEQHMVAD